MPLYKEWKPKPHSHAAIWHIAEPEAFFAGKLCMQGSHIQHPKRRIEFLAARFLLQYLYKDFPLYAIFRDEQNKPQLPNREWHFSITHSFPYVACIISSQSTVGIDIQCWNDNILAIQHKFLSEVEQAYCQGEAQKITTAWTAKEAAYKYQGLQGVAFIEHLPIIQWKAEDFFYHIEIKLQLLNGQPILPIQSQIYPDFAFSVCG